MFAKSRLRSFNTPFIHLPFSTHNGFLDFQAVSAYTLLLPLQQRIQPTTYISNTKTLPTPTYFTPSISTMQHQEAIAERQYPPPPTSNSDLPSKEDVRTQGLRCLQAIRHDASVKGSKRMLESGTNPIDREMEKCTSTPR
jgi:hypothetical protein